MSRLYEYWYRVTETRLVKVLAHNDTEAQEKINEEAPEADSIEFHDLNEHNPND